MTRRRTGLAAAAFLTTAALVLTGCGGDSGEDDGDGGIPGVDAGGPEDTDAGPEDEPEDDPVTPEDAIDRPDVTLPEHMTNVFETPETTDERDLAVIADAQHRRNGVDVAIDEGDLEHPALEFYGVRQGLVDTVTYVNRFVADDDTWTGTARYYDWQVEDGDTEDAAVLRYCMDESQAFDMDKETGDVTERETQDSDYVVFQERLERNELGVWQRVAVTSERGADLCVP